MKYVYMKYEHSTLFREQVVPGTVVVLLLLIVNSAFPSSLSCSLLKPLIRTDINSILAVIYLTDIHRDDCVHPHHDVAPFHIQADVRI
jgi:hypothetical protein